MTETTPFNPSIKPTWTKADQWIFLFSKNWLLFLGVFFGIWIGLPFLAPVFLAMGLESPAKAIYLLYSFQCHQLPQRSFFLFGSQGMYSLGEIQNVWRNTINPLILRQFIGNPEMGWKVAWSDRMVFMYTSILIFGGFWWFLHRKVKWLPWWGLIILLLPMALDGTSHLISDFAGIGQGFRDSNLWLATLTNNAFSSSFYTGDALGSFNSWVRFLTGVLFGLGVVWFSFPFLDKYFSDLASFLETKFNRATE